MEITELQRKKYELSEEVSNFIRSKIIEFHKETGVWVTNVYPRIDFMGLARGESIFDVTDTSITLDI